MTTRRGFSNAANSVALVGTLDSSSSTNAITVSPAPSGWPSTLPLFACIDKGTASEEVVLVTALSGTNMTITRGGSLSTTYGSTTKTHANGATIQHVASAQDYDEANAHTSSNSGVHGVTGNVVGTTDTQTLTSKTLITPTLSVPAIADFTSAQHTHASAAQGGTHLHAFHGVRVQNSTDQATSAGGALSPVLWNAENYDTDAYHSTSTNTGRLTVPSGLDGYYNIHAMIAVEDSTTAPDIDVEIRLNGVTVITGFYSTLVNTAGGAVYIPLGTIYHLAAGDYVSLHVQVTPGAVKSVYGTGSGIQASFGMGLIGT